MINSEKQKILSFIEYMISYPAKGNSKKSKAVYPHEFAYDEFAYKRIVDSYREGLGKLKELVQKMETRK